MCERFTLQTGLLASSQHRKASLTALLPARPRRSDESVQSATRRQQMDAIELGGNSIHEWSQFLAGEQQRGVLVPELVQCYYRATNSIPATADIVRSDHYIQLWLDYAKLQMCVCARVYV